MMANAPPPQAQHALPVRIIDHDQRLVLRRHCDDLRQWRDRAVLRKTPSVITSRRRTPEVRSRAAAKAIS